MASVQELNERVQREARAMRAVLDEMKQVIVGQQSLMTRLLIALLTNGHILIEGLPGLAKTLTIRTLAACMDMDFQRVQFTPDLLPADLIGTQIYNPRTGEFTPRTGPVFTNILLADEINRAPAKVQSALLEAMAEQQVTLGDVTHKLATPFMVLATQNPLEQEGTYPLPEAQLDRFMMKVVISYPSRSEEREIIDRMMDGQLPSVNAVADGTIVAQSRQAVRDVYVDDRLKDYVLDIVAATRNPGASGLSHLTSLISVGASPRASLALVQAGRAHAFLHGRGYVTPDDIKRVALDVLRHRIIITFEAEAESILSDQIIQQILAKIAVP